MNLYAVDLNLLVVLEALLAEAHVTRAAKLVGLSQPAMSNALSRLRELFNDPLLVRTTGGMQPTPRAEELRGPLVEALRVVRENVLSPKGFDPARSVMSFRLAAADYEQLVLLPQLMRRLAAEAPGVSLELTIPSSRLPVEDLAHGRIDAMIGVHEEMHGGLYKTPVLEDRFVCALRSGHPLERQRLTLARYVAMEHLLISPFGGMTGSVDQALAAQGLRRVVKVAVPHFALAPWVLIRSDYVLTLPERAGVAYAEHLPLKLVKPPLTIPGFKEHLYWHERTHRDPAHRWFRQLLKEVASV